MELQYYGANALKITTKKSALFVDPISDIAPLNIDAKKVPVILATQHSFLPSTSEENFVIEGPGEYEFEDFSIKGIATQAHTAPSGDKSATMYRIVSGDIRLLVTGHIDAKLSEEQLEAIGIVDIVVVPVGGNGYTLDAASASQVVRKLEPKIVIPVNSAEDKFTYQVPQDAADLFVKELGASVAEDQPDKFKVKSLPEQLVIQRLQKQ